jgi:hypothetical protein
MNKAAYIGIPVGLVVLASAVALPLNAWAWNGTQGCTPGYFKNNADTNPRVAQLYGINLNAAILDITGLNLGAPSTLTIDQAIKLTGGGNNALYRALGAAVFNTYYGDNNGDGTLDINFIEPTTLTGYVQQALNGDVTGAASAIDAANNLGCSVDAFGRVI